MEAGLEEEEGPEIKQDQQKTEGANEEGDLQEGDDDEQYSEYDDKAEESNDQ